MRVVRNVGRVSKTRLNIKGGKAVNPVSRKSGQVKRRHGGPSDGAVPNQTVHGPYSRINPEQGPGPADFVSGLRADRTALSKMRQNFRMHKNAGIGTGNATLNALSDYFTATDLPDVARGAAMWRRGITAGAVGMVGLGMGSRVLDWTFGSSRRY